MELELIDNFHRLNKIYTQQTEPVCARWGLTQNEILVILFLSSHPEVNRAVDLVNYCSMVKSHVSKSIHHLEAQGLLQRKADEFDRRTVHLFLTAAAVPIAQEVIRIHDDFLAGILRGISAEELHVYQSISAKIANNLSELE